MQRPWRQVNETGKIQKSCKNWHSDVKTCVNPHLKQMIKSRQCFDENVCAFVAELIPASDEKVKRFFQIEVEMPVEMSTNELVKFFLGHRVKILELVKGRELFDVETIGCDDVRLALQQMFRFVPGDFWHRREDVWKICSGTFDTITAENDVNKARDIWPHVNWRQLTDDKSDVFPLPRRPRTCPSCCRNLFFQHTNNVREGSRGS